MLQASLWRCWMPVCTMRAAWAVRASCAGPYLCHRATDACAPPPFAVVAALRFLEVMRHLQHQAFAQDAAFDMQELELLVLMARSDVVHTLGGEPAAAAPRTRTSSTTLHGALRRAPCSPACHTRKRPCRLPPPADVSYQAYALLDSYLQRFPYAAAGRQLGGPHDGRPLLVLDERAAWQPLAALA